MSISFLSSNLTKFNSFSSRIHIVRYLCEPSDPCKNVKIIQSCAPKPKLCLDVEEKKSPIKPKTCSSSGGKPSGKDETDLSKKFAKLRQLQEKFQRPDGVPVFLKMGFRDQLLYRLTMLLAIFGLAGIVKMVAVEMD